MFAKRCFKGCYRFRFSNIKLEDIEFSNVGNDALDGSEVIFL